MLLGSVGIQLVGLGGWWTIEPSILKVTNKQGTNIIHRAFYEVGLWDQAIMYKCVNMFGSSEHLNNVVYWLGSGVIVKKIFFKLW